MDDNQIINPEVEDVVDDDQLTHHGVKGMKWGVRRTPAQLGHKPSTTRKKKAAPKSSTAKKKPASKEIKEKLKDVKGKIDKYRKTRAKQQAAKAAEKEKKTKEEYEAAKKKAIESGSADEVLKYQGKLSNQELQIATGRLNMEAQLSQMSSKTKKTGLDRLEETANKIDRIRGAAEKGIAAWNTYAKIHNSLSPNDLPTLDGKYKDRQAERKARADKAAAEEHIKKMKKLVESGTPEEIAKHFGKIPIDILKDAKNRFEYEEGVKKYFSKSESKSDSTAESSSGGNSGMRTRKFKRKQAETIDPNTPYEIVNSPSSSKSGSSKSGSSTTKEVYESTFRDITPAEISSGRSYADRLLSPPEDK